jgi:hypothetical protein
MNFRNTAAELRKRAIQESKFLGGDMEHTHLVKGLDFALLQKVFLCFVLIINLVKHERATVPNKINNIELWCL